MTNHDPAQPWQTDHWAEAATTETVTDYDRGRADRERELALMHPADRQRIFDAYQPEPDLCPGCGQDADHDPGECPEDYDQKIPVGDSGKGQAMRQQASGWHGGA